MRGGARAFMGGAGRRPRAAVVLALLAAALAGCGGSSGAAGAASGGAGVGALSSVSCSSTGVIGQRRISSACTFTLSDGRRFRCPPRFAAGPGVSLTRIEHAAACVQLKALAISAPLRALARRIAVVRACLAAHGMRFAGGIVVPPQAGPAGELQSASALIGFYADAAGAARAAPALERRARQGGAALTRAGLENILWISHPALRARARIVRCLTR